MSGRLSAAMLAEVSKPEGERKLAVIGRWYGPTTQTWGRFPAGYAEWGTGTDEYWRPRVKAWGEFGESVDIVGYGCGVQSKRVEIVESDDPNSLDYKWWTKLDGAGYRLAGTLLVVYLSSPNVAEADWCQLFSGSLESGWDHVGHLRWGLSFKPLDSALTSPMGVSLNEADWPLATQDLLDTNIAQVWGQWQSWSAGQRGSITAIMVDSATFKYVLAFGYMHAVDRVYSAGAVVAVANYAISYPTINGRVFTVVTFTATQGANVITADVHGYNTTGTSAGTFISDPTDGLEHMLLNMAFNKSGGLWYTRATAPVLGIHTASFDAAKTFGTNRANGTALRCSRYVRTPTTPLAELGAWCETTGIPAYWRRDGTLALAVDSPHKSAYVSTPVLYPADFGARIQWPKQCKQPCDRVRVQVGDSAAGIVVDVTVRDSLGAGDHEDNATLGYGPATGR
jgi:hypothetical protein